MKGTHNIWVFMLYLFSIISVILLWENNILLTFVLLIFSVIFLNLWRGKKEIITFFVGLAFGTISESTCIYFGVWQYANPTFLIPLWLPVLWGIAALVIRRFTIYLEKKR